MDKILQDCDEDMQMEEGVKNSLLENEAKRPERRRMDDLDECLDTIFCDYLKQRGILQPKIYFLVR